MGRIGIVGPFVLVSLAACVAQLPALKPALPPPTAMMELQDLIDPSFNGGLTAGELALSRRVAAEMNTQLPEDFKPCPKLDLMAGAMVTNLNKTEPTEISANLQPFVDIALHGSPVQQAVAFHAVKIMGPRTQALEPAFRGKFNEDRNAWQAEAMSTYSCDQYTDGGINALVPDQYRPTSNGACDAARVDWIFKAVADRSRVWPAQFFRTAWRDVIESCKRTGVSVSVPVSDEDLVRLEPLLVDPKIDPDLAAALMEMLVDLGVHAKILEPMALTLIDSKNKDIAAGAQEVVVISGAPESVEILRRWLDGEEGLYWNWVDYIPFLTRYSDQIVPMVAPLLKDKDRFIHADAAIALGLLHDRQAIQPLLSAVDSRDWVTSQSAVAALAQFAATDQQVRRSLETISHHYWSGRVREVARVALSSGRGITGDPFGDCDPAPVITAEGMEHPAESGPGLRCIRINYGGSIDHHQKACRDGKFHSGTYETPNHRRFQIHWRGPIRQELPRGHIGDLSTWCKSVGEVEILRTQNGWLVGCSGFESSGSLGFIPTAADQPLERIGYLDTRTLSKMQGKIYVSASEPFAFDDAGMLAQVTRQADGKWLIQPVAALPSPPTAVAVLGKAIAFSDELNAVLYEPEGLSLLSCQD